MPGAKHIKGDMKEETKIIKAAKEMKKEDVSFLKAKGKKK